MSRVGMNKNAIPKILNLNFIICLLLYTDTDTEKPIYVFYNPKTLRIHKDNLKAILKRSPMRLNKVGPNLLCYFSWRKGGKHVCVSSLINSSICVHSAKRMHLKKKVELYYINGSAIKASTNQPPFELYGRLKK